MEASRRSGLSPAQITHYLKFISYNVGVKEERGYKQFVREAKKRGLNPSFGKIRY
jgi:predicted solute-binding protein